jgi:hypothetical protein
LLEASGNSSHIRVFSESCTSSLYQSSAQAMPSRVRWMRGPAPTPSSHAGYSYARRSPNSDRWAPAPRSSRRSLWASATARAARCQYRQSKTRQMNPLVPLMGQPYSPRGLPSSPSWRRPCGHRGCLQVGRGERASVRAATYPYQSADTHFRGMVVWLCTRSYDTLSVP